LKRREVNIMEGTGDVVGGEIDKASGAFFFLWTTLALGVTAMFSVVLNRLLTA
jgi:hypothetical protein